MPTFQFADWPIPLSEDLRILARHEDDTDEFRTVYSI